ncbi:unnamed protein product [Rodentolepis nana]|uniref:Uncharacterized protein n=1 Tax=Rodentolepis nana TaxID=102285 RepID=A0A0R3TIQ5_RODNA|nr:unnamed protein product [Rodentolepis nana]
MQSETQNRNEHRFSQSENDLLRFLHEADRTLSEPKVSSQDVGTSEESTTNHNNNGHVDPEVSSLQNDKIDTLEVRIARALKEIEKMASEFKALVNPFPTSNAQSGREADVSASFRQLPTSILSSRFVNRDSSFDVSRMNNITSYSYGALRGANDTKSLILNSNFNSGKIFAFHIKASEEPISICMQMLIYLVVCTMFP